MSRSHPKVALITLGCPKNQVDSEVLAGELRRHGAMLVSDPGRADAVVINTCAFIADAKQESIDAVLEAVRLKRGAGGKKAGRGPRIVVWGCLPARYREELAKAIPEADAFFGVEAYRDISRWLFGPSYRWSDSAYCGRVPSTASHVAYLKIADGCDHRCTFCAIPIFKGPFRSRTPGSLVREAEHLAGRGVKELILVAQDTTAFGRDLGEGIRLSGLIRRLARLDGIEWIRILYGHPAHVDSELIECVASEPKVCKSLDIPLQHAADPMLKAMGRGMTRTSIERVLHRLREGIPGLVLRTTFIVGFPGETEPLFRELRAFVREARFERLGAFSYSAEEGTLAFGLNHPVPPATARRRLRELMETQHHIAAEIHRGLESKTVAVRVDGFDRLQCLHAGRTQGDAPDVDPTVWVRGLPRTADAIGRVWPVRIEGSSAYDLIGTVEKKR